ncbi:acyl-CoA thioester hydrolase [Ekhidna lutea]|uniref:Acyl-CoA thioester hydrolase n=1 Tax=Ekhidna lutea TaxID=447679 RepID=A0A239FKG5_EKHLU|nr:thioesterase family protein [Ekhidna lutea]SNS57410.1 acyl-CoA thioester hydrolase [Ekhidna lutea]
MKIFENKITVTKDHLDFNDHVNNLVYMQWALDISREHWLSEINEEINEDYFWMVRSHHVEYEKQAFLGDEIIVKTYVEGYRGPFSNRIVKIFKGEELLVQVKTNWCLIDRETQKLKRVPEEIQILFK